ncbi:50S ribosomal protein L25 [Patescibacteria group bacterium]|nr:50S ribosomal protein L25 [Patescibacteria group bacterium]MBU1868051.1 50S ribosomal protein L25 [Patescibacteria group bacterium]
MVKETQLKAEKRGILGSKIKKLRKQGILPANIYGSGLESLTIQLSVDEFLKTFKEAGETELIYLQVKGEKEKRPVLIRHIQAHPVTNQILHTDFLQVDLTEETTTDVPITFVGEAPAVKVGTGMLLEILTELEVTCLPTDIPSEIEVDISKLADVNDAIIVKDLKLPSKVKTDLDPDEVVCKIEPAQTEEEVEEAQAEEVPGGEETAPEGEETAKKDDKPKEEPSEEKTKKSDS